MNKNTIGPCIPPLNVTDKEAQRLVQGSPLLGLEPGPGMSSQNWQQLAAMATQLPDITWLGNTIYDWNNRDKSGRYGCPMMPVIDGHMCMNFPVIHAGQRTDHDNYGHRKRFAEKVLKYGGIDFVLRLFSLYPAEEFTNESHNVLHIFQPISGGPKAFLHYLPKLRYFLMHLKQYITPRLQKCDQMWKLTNIVDTSATAKRKRDAEVGPFICRFLTTEGPVYKKEAKPLTAQMITNTLLLIVVCRGDPSTAIFQEAVRSCRENLGAQLTTDDELLYDKIFCSMNGWTEILNTCHAKDAFSRFKACITPGAPISTPDVQVNSKCNGIKEGFMHVRVHA
jgi:hypothetical protein